MSSGRGGWPRPWRWCMKWPPRDLFPFKREFASTVNSASLVISCPIPGWAAFRQAARISSPMYRRDSVHSSFCSARTAPTSRTMASRPGKMPTTSVRRLILWWMLPGRSWRGSRSCTAPGAWTS
jgi:hypothetical protein